MLKLRRERRAASAAAGRIRILEREARSHHIRRMVDGDAIQILCRKHIDKEPDVILIHNKIACFRFFLDIEAVLKSRTSARYDTNPKA